MVYAPYLPSKSPRWWYGAFIPAMGDRGDWLDERVTLP